jgi:hypothetical protein
MDGWMDSWLAGWMARGVGGWLGGGRLRSNPRNSARLDVLTAGLMKNQIVWYYEQLLWLLHLENYGTTTLQKVGNYRYEPHNDVSVNDGPHIRKVAP